MSKAAPVAKPLCQCRLAGHSATDIRCQGPARQSPRARRTRSSRVPSRRGRRAARIFRFLRRDGASDRVASSPACASAIAGAAGPPPRPHVAPVYLGVFAAGSAMARRIMLLPGARAPAKGRHAPAARPGLRPIDISSRSGGFHRWNRTVRPSTGQHSGDAFARCLRRRSASP